MFVQPELEVVYFVDDDIITTSVGKDQDSDDLGDWLEF